MDNLLGQFTDRFQVTLIFWVTSEGVKSVNLGKVCFTYVYVRYAHTSINMYMPAWRCTHVSSRTN